MLRTLTLFLIFIILASVTSCKKEETLREKKEEILAKVGDRVITVDEFIRRAEYTVRPPYCRNNSGYDKKIILNSLIAEKLFAIQASDTNQFITNPVVQAYLTGVKEQLMRQWLYEAEALSKVKLDTQRVWQVVRVAGRKYKISYANLPDSALAAQLARESRQKGFEAAYQELVGLDTIPKREVEWNFHESDLVLDSLYSMPLKKNQVVGPLHFGEQGHVVLKIDGWIDRIALTEKQIADRFRNVSDRFSERYARQIYNNFIRKVMKGKQIEFDRDTFFKVAELLRDVYYIPNSKKKQMLNDRMWNKNSDIEKYQNSEDKLKDLYQRPFFKVDGQVWTVERFVQELRKHPLVFRKNHMKLSEFPQQLQFAIMDMITDRYLADIAYERGYDKIGTIQHRVQMWKDNLNYQYFKYQYLKNHLPDSLRNENYLTIIQQFLNPLVDSLQTRYSDQIEVNVDAFNRIRLTRIDLHVFQPDNPWPLIVPSFPLVTTDYKLDYGKKMAVPQQQ